MAQETESVSNTLAVMRGSAPISEVTTQEILKVLTALSSLSTQMMSLEEKLQTLQVELEKSNVLLSALSGRPLPE